MPNCSCIASHSRAFSASSKAANKASAVFIVGAARTPIGSFRSALASVPAPQLAAEAMKATLQRAGVPAGAVQEVFLGQVIQANCGQAPARQATLAAGCDVSTAVTTVNKVCSSGLKAVMLAAQQIQTEHQDVVFGGGMESMSQVPFYMPRGDTTYGGVTLQDGIIKDGLTDAYDNVHMGICGEKAAAEMGISREEQDAYAISSYTRSFGGAIGPEVVPITVKTRKGVTTVEKDEEFTRIDFDKIKKLKPVFKKDGTVTAANSSTLNDGAAAVLLASEDAIKRLGVTPLARVLAYGDAAVKPIDVANAPPLLVSRMLKAAGLTLADIDHFECNEAFSVVALAFQKKLNVDPAKLNPHGGAVSLGHPIGMSGARLITHLVHSLTKGQKGLAAICNGGGGASGMIIEKL